MNKSNYQKTQKIIGIDPASAKLVAYCLMDNGRIIDYGKIRFDVHQWNEFLSQYKGETLAMEGQFLKIYANNLGNVKGFKSLHAAAVAIKTIAELNDMNVVTIMPSTWQSKMLRTHFKMKSNVLKRLSKERASATIGRKIVDSDIADAVCIAEYYYRFTKQQGL